MKLPYKTYYWHVNFKKLTIHPIYKNINQQYCYCNTCITISEINGVFNIKMATRVARTIRPRINNSTSLIARLVLL